jgi:hypothetical protein
MHRKTYVKASVKNTNACCKIENSCAIVHSASHHEGNEAVGVDFPAVAIHDGGPASRIM